MSGTNADLDTALTAAADRFATPAYVYFADRIQQRLERLRDDFGPWFSLSFAVKSNPNPQLLKWLASRIDGVDVSSAGEFARVCAAGWGPERASFTGPAKRAAELDAAIAGGLGELVIESLREARLADAIAGRLGRRQQVLVRIAPDRVPKGFGDQMAGRPSPFGIDVEMAVPALRDIAALRNLRLKGLHIYSGTQCLRPEAIGANWRIFMAIFRDLCAAVDLVPEKLVFGAGLGIPYHPGDVALDTSAVAAAIAADLDAFRAEPRFRDAGLVLELGRHLVGEAGFFVTRVVSVKHSRGTRIAICDGGMNAHLAASGHFGMVLRRAYDMHRVGAHDGSEPQRIDICGPLCTSIDRLGSGVALPRVEEGDLIAIHSSGAYGPSASPVRFIAHPEPREIWVEGSQMRDVTP